MIDRKLMSGWYELSKITKPQVGLELKIIHTALNRRPVVDHERKEKAPSFAHKWSGQYQRKRAW